jgi:hypothetical protein
VRASFRGEVERIDAVGAASTRSTSVGCTEVEGLGAVGTVSRRSTSPGVSAQPAGRVRSVGIVPGSTGAPASRSASAMATAVS